MLIIGGVLSLSSVLVAAVQLPRLDIFGEEGGSEVTRYPRQARVLNFFPIPFEEECNSLDRRRKGICMNTYECKIREGKSHGFCALGFGVCCVFTATCNEQSINNITYFINPDFPDLTSGPSSCDLVLRRIDEDITQLRLDFVHFNLGQPNRKTGVCEEDYLQLSSQGDQQALTICGVNSGQHVYYDIEMMSDPITISIKLGSKTFNRLWEIRIIQVPFSQRAPVGCLQFYTGRRGVIKTMNFADNGRHLANQDYTICIQQEEGMCSIVYEPCYENAFRISPNTPESDTVSVNEIGSGDFEDQYNMQNGDAGYCNDRVVIPCNTEYLIFEADQGMSDTCETVHCGQSLCPPGQQSPCRIESSALPFAVGVRFGPSLRNESPEDNLGMCLSYEQQSCDV